MSDLIYLKNLLVLETTSFGFVYFLIQKYTTNSDIKVFEATPTPRGAILVLAAQNVEWLEKIEAEVKNNNEQIENIRLCANVSEKVLAAYLNQILEPLKDHLVLLESDSICESLKALTMAIKANMDVCEFRILRSSTYKCVISLSTKLTEDEVARLFKLITPKKVQLNYFSHPTFELRQQFNLE